MKYTTVQIRAAYLEWTQTSDQNQPERDSAWANYVDHRDGLPLGTTKLSMITNRRMKEKLARMGLMHTDSGIELIKPIQPLR